MSKTTAKTDELNLLAAIPQPFLALNRDGQLMYLNLAAEEFFAASRNLMIGKTFSSFVPFGSPILSLIEQVFKTGHSVNEYNIDLGTPRNGRKKPVDVLVAPVSSDASGTVGSFNDIDDLESVIVIIQQRSIASKIDQQLTHRGAVRSVSGMAAMLAHEIKNPLSGIRGAAQLLESDLSEADKNLTSLICAEADRIAGLVDEFEVFTDSPREFDENLNIHSILNHVIQLARAGFAKKLKINEVYDPSLPPLRGNRDQLIQVFLNLVKNGAEACDAKNGEITLITAFRPGVRLAVPGKGKRVSLPLEFSVIDNGAGIDEDLKHIIFEPFVTGKQGGSGLGLALVAKIIGDHGGIIECETESGQTIFRVLMPMSATPSDTQENINE